jgi:hypothetical protein
MKIELTFGTVIILQVSNVYSKNAPMAKKYQGGQGFHHMQLRANRMKGTLKVDAGEDVYVINLTVPD